MSINPKWVQKSEIECKKLKLSAKKWSWAQNEEIKVIDSSYFELGQTKWRTKIKRRLKLFTKFQYNYLITEAQQTEAQQQLLIW